MMAIPNRWLVLAAMTGSLSMVLLDQTVVSVALPTIASDLHLGPTQQQWIINAYLLTLSALVALCSRLGDKFGGVTLFRLGVIVFFLGSAGCGLAPDTDMGGAWIIGFRLVQGAGAAMMMPVSAAIVLSVFDKSESGRAMAIYGGIGQLFLALGPLVGGFLTEYVSWRAVFWLNIPVGAVVLFLVFVAKPPDRQAPDTYISLRNAAFLVFGIATTVFALQQGAHWGWLSASTLIAIAAGLASCAAFVVLSLRVRRPLVNLRLLGDIGFASDLFIAFFVRFSLLSVSLYFAMYLQDVLGLPASRAGLLMLPMVVPQIIGSQVSGWAYDWLGVRTPTLTGLALCICGLAWWSFALTTRQYHLLIPAMILSGFAFGLTLSAPGTDALAREPGELRNQASGMLLTFRQVGGALGVAIIGAIILHLSPQATRAPDPQTSADAISAGFAALAVVAVVVAILSFLLLPRTGGRTGSQLP